MSPDELYTRLYRALCGPPHAPRPWHFQWHGVHMLRRRLAETLPGLGGDVLDLGCGGKPYRHLFGPGVRSYLGADVAPGPAVDVPLTPGGPLPFATASFDVVLCTQVLEHASDLDGLWREIVRVLKPGGALVLSVPFLYHLHGEPHDYRRFTAFGLRRMLEPDFRPVDISAAGGIGGTLAVNLLAWTHMQANATRLGRYLFALALPAWLALCLGLNLLGLALDSIPDGGRFPHLYFLAARRRTGADHG